jgi:LPXTG-motif cell wall-anchored protein
MKNKDDRYTYFESNDTSVARWRLFAISGTRNSLNEVTPVPTEPIVITSPVPETGYSIPWLLIILVIILVGSVAYYLYKRGKKEK